MSQLLVRRASSAMAQRSRAGRRGMGSVQSTYALSGMGSVQSTYAFSGMGAADSPVADLTEAQWRAAMLAKQSELVEWQGRWVKRDELQRWIQIAATLSIPIAAALWRLVFGKRVVDG